MCPKSVFFDVIVKIGNKDISTLIKGMMTVVERWHDICGRWFFQLWSRNHVIMQTSVDKVCDSLQKYCKEHPTKDASQYLRLLDENKNETSILHG